MIYSLDAYDKDRLPFTVALFRSRRKARRHLLWLFRTQWQWCRSLADLRISRIGVR